MSRSRVAVLVCTTFFAVASSILLVACCRSETFSTEVVAAGAASPAVVVRVAAGALDATITVENIPLLQQTTRRIPLGTTKNVVHTRTATGIPDTIRERLVLRIFLF